MFVCHYGAARRGALNVGDLFAVYRLRIAITTDYLRHSTMPSMANLGLTGSPPINAGQASSCTPNEPASRIFSRRWDTWLDCHSNKERGKTNHRIYMQFMPNDPG